MPVLNVTTIADPTLWTVTILGVLALLAVDFLLTRRPHEVSIGEAIRWSVFYIALPLAFGVWVWLTHGSQIGLEYYTGYLVEKSLSVDNLFVFILILSAFAVPRELQQRTLLIGIIGALIMRAAFIAVGAVLIAQFTWMFLIFGAVLLVTAWGVLRDARHGGHSMDVQELRLVKLVRRWFPVTEDYHGPRLSVRIDGRRALTPLALVVIAILGVLKAGGAYVPVDPAYPPARLAFMLDEIRQGLAGAAPVLITTPTAEAPADTLAARAVATAATSDRVTERRCFVIDEAPWAGRV